MATLRAGDVVVADFPGITERSPDGTECNPGLRFFMPWVSLRSTQATY